MRVRRDAVAIGDFDPKHERAFFGWVTFQDGDLRALGERCRPFFSLDFRGQEDFKCPFVLFADDGDERQGDK
jgi:hypothetical protein